VTAPSDPLHLVMAQKRQEAQARSWHVAKQASCNVYIVHTTG